MPRKKTDKNPMQNVRRNVLLEDMGDKDFNALSSKLKEHRYETGEVIFDDESPAGDLYLIAEGRVKIAKEVKSGQETVLALLHDRDFFGELAPIDGLPRAGSAIAIEESTIYSINKADFIELLKHNHAFTLKLLQMLTLRLRTIDNTFVRELQRNTERAISDINKLAQLIDAAKIVNSTLDLDKLLGVILEAALQGVNADRGTVYLIDDVKGELWSKVLTGSEMVEIRLPVGKGIAGHVAATGDVVNIPDAYVDPRFNPDFDKKTGYHTKTILCMPLKNKDGKIVGVFQMINKGKGTFSYDDESFIDALSIHASIAIENARLAQEMVRTERLSTIGQMASSIIHDIKNPMGTIRLYAQVLKKKSGNEEAIKMADEMIRQVDRLVAMLQEILDFSRGVSATNFEEVPLGDTMEAIMAFIEKDLVKNNIQLVRDIKYSGPMVMDADKMTRVFYNIASNARDAMPSGGTLTVSTELIDGDVHFSFKDTGTGMPAEIKARIFEPFVTYGKKHGTGLGMAIVKKVIDDHNGRIEIDSEMGKGTTMRFIIPVKH